MTTAEVVGSAGVALLLLAFALNLLGRIDRSSTGYQALNAVGAGLAATASYQIGFIPFVVLEGSWCAVALYALVRPSLARKGVG